jgi:ROK family protein
MTRLTTPLVAAGILKEQRPVPVKQLGRPALPLVVVDDAARFVGIKVVPGELHAVVTGLAGHVRATEVRSADTSTLESTAKAVAQVVDDFADHEPNAVGVALAAAVDPLGEVRASPLLGWESGNLAALVTKACGVACKAANDVDALTLAEHWVGHGRGTHNFAVITVGAGVGAGVVIADELLVGHQGSTGMVGEAWTTWGQRIHDALADEPLRAAASEAAGWEITMEELRTSDDPAVSAVLDRAAKALGELVVLVKQFWGPEKILLTGEGIIHFEDRIDLVRQVTVERRFEDIDPPELVIAEQDFNAWARGAAALATRLSLAY